MVRWVHPEGRKGGAWLEVYLVSFVESVGYGSLVGGW
jgi:hypothetical protein